MQYAFMSFSCPELTLEENLALAKRLGFGGIEPRTASEHKHGIETDAGSAEREGIKARAAESGIALCCVATSCSYADPDTARDQVEETHRYIDLAGDVGAPRLRVFGGRIGGGLDRDQAIDLLVKSLRQVADHASERGVTVCVETHDDWCEPDHLAAVMKGVDHPAVAVNWDIMHPVRIAGATMDRAFEALRPWVRHVHFHDGTQEGDKLQLVPIGEGMVDHRRAVQLLMAGAYEGWLSGEWIRWEPAEVHLPRELATMKGYEAE